MKRSLIFLIIFFFIISASTGVVAHEIGFGYQTSVVHVVGMVADHAGFFEEVGLEANTQVFSSGPLVSEAIGSGALEFGMMGDAPAIIAVARDLPVKIIASAGGGADRQRMMVRADSEMESIYDLEGKRLGIRMGTSAHGGFLSLAEVYDFDPYSVQMMDVNPPDMPDALATNQVDAILVWESTPTLIEDRGIGRELLTLRESGNHFPVFLLANQRYLDRNPEVAPMVLEALKLAVDFIEEYPEKTEQIVAEVTGLSPELARKSMDYHYYDLELGAETLESLRQTSEYLLEEGLIPRLPDYETEVDASLLE